MSLQNRKGKGLKMKLDTLGEYPDIGECGKLHFKNQTIAIIQMLSWLIVRK